jgi:hypothetical protein
MLIEQCLHWRSSRRSVVDDSDGDGSQLYLYFRWLPRRQDIIKESPKKPRRVQWQVACVFAAIYADVNRPLETLTEG